MPKGSQNKRPVDRDLEENMRDALDPERDLSARKPWFEKDSVEAKKLAESFNVPQESWRIPRSWVRGTIRSQGEVIVHGEILAQDAMEDLLPHTPLVYDGHYVVRYSFADEPVRYSYFPVSAVVAMTLNSEA